MSTAKIKVPKGWKRLRKGTTIVASDKWLVAATDVWRRTMTPGHRVSHGIYIRRLTKPTKGRKDKST